jgi:predicted membrane-bound spermidine synthase
MILQALMWGVCVLLVVYVMATGNDQPHQPSPWIFVLFFISGFPALIYQIVWQRALFLVFGVNIESVTIVVTAFIIGLGLGSFLGGQLSTKHVSPLLLFGAFEIAVGVFGALSLPLFHWVARHTFALSTLQTATLSMLLVTVPTLLMGSTLPLLVSYLITHSTQNVGRSVGKLYFANTLGSALACFISAHLTMGLLGQSGSVWLACVLNLSVGAAVLTIWFHLLDKPPLAAQPTEHGENSAPIPLPAAHAPVPNIPFSLATLTAGLVGFIALAYEIVWYRLYSFVLGGRALSFAMLLGAYLMGIAYGSLVAESLCRKQEEAGTRLHVGLIGWLIVLFNVIGFLVAAVMANLVGIIGAAAPLLPIGLAAGCLGSTFPLIAHLSVARDRRAGAGVSYLYLSNMIGSALGSFVVGFLLMDVWPVRSISVGLVVLGIAVGLCLVGVSKATARHLATVGLMFVIAVAAIPPTAKILYSNIYEKLLYKGAFSKGPRFRFVVENKSGVIAVSEDDTVYGGGVFDGRFNVDPINDRNLIVRC